MNDDTFCRHRWWRANNDGTTSKWERIIWNGYPETLRDRRINFILQKFDEMQFARSMIPDTTSGWPVTSIGTTYSTTEHFILFTSQTVLYLQAEETAYVRNYPFCASSQAEQSCALPIVFQLPIGQRSSNSWKRRFQALRISARGWELIMPGEASSFRVTSDGPIKVFRLHCGLYVTRPWKRSLPHVWPHGLAKSFPWETNEANCRPRPVWNNLVSLRFVLGYANGIDAKPNNGVSLISRISTDNAYKVDFSCIRM